MKIKFKLAHLNPQLATPRFLALCLLVAGLLLAVIGCKPQANPRANLDPSGVYSLVNVNDKRVPCELVHEGVTLTVKSGVFTIMADGRCTSQMTFSLPSRGDMSKEVKAAFTQQGTELIMHWEGAGTTVGSVHGNTFIMTNEDMVLAYRK